MSLQTLPTVVCPECDEEYALDDNKFSMKVAGYCDVSEEKAICPHCGECVECGTAHERGGES